MALVFFIQNLVLKVIWHHKFLQKNYEGTSVDVFAAGVILFIMYAGNPPFEKASPNDPYYRLIKDKNYAVFWKAHSRRRPVNFFNDQFKDIFTKMVAFNPE